jgi:pimeloyl-ACP methyl ester carboxylesterase
LDPAVTDGFAYDREVILFNNAGVSSSSGEVPTTFEKMGANAVAFIKALGLTTVDVLGFSIGGFIAQQIALQAPDLVRRLVLVGTGPRGGEGMATLTPEAQEIFGATYDDPDHLWLHVHFTHSEKSQAAGREFLKRFRLRTENRDPEVNEKAAPAQIEAIDKWGEYSWVPAAGLAAVSTALSASGKYLSPHLPEAALQFVGSIISFGVITLLFAMMFKWLPDTSVRWRDVWLGAAITASLFEIGKLLISVYIGKQALESTYGAAASLVLVLVWIYYSSQIVLMDAEFTHVYTSRRGSRKQRPDSVQPWLQQVPEPFCRIRWKASAGRWSPEANTSTRSQTILNAIIISLMSRTGTRQQSLYSWAAFIRRISQMHNLIELAPPWQERLDARHKAGRDNPPLR